MRVARRLARTSRATWTRTQASPSKTSRTCQALFPANGHRLLNLSMIKDATVRRALDFRTDTWWSLVWLSCLCSYWKSAEFVGWPSSGLYRHGLLALNGTEPIGLLREPTISFWLPRLVKPVRLFQLPLLWRKRKLLPLLKLSRWISLQKHLHLLRRLQSWIRWERMQLIELLTRRRLEIW